MLKLIMIEVKQGFVWGYSGSKILDGCNKGVTYTTPGERMGYTKKNVGLFREYMYFPVFWDRRYAIRKIKTDMHGCVQLDACNWLGGGGGGGSLGRVGMVCGS